MQSVNLIFLENLFFQFIEFLDHKSYFDLNRSFVNNEKCKSKVILRNKTSFYLQFKNPQDESLIKYEAFILRFY